MPSNPFGAPGRPARPSEIGQGYSGSVHEVKLGKTERIQINLAEITPAGYTGLAAVHIHVKDVSPEPENGTRAPGAVENTVLIGDLTWGSGIGGGRELLDLTRGGLAMVGGTSHISLDLTLRSSIEGEAPVLWRTKRVQLTVNWYGNAHEAPSYTSPGLVTAGADTTAFIPIPPQASWVQVDTDNPAILPALIAEFSTNNDPAGSGIKYRTLDPNANGTKIHSGVEFVRLVTTGAGTFFFVWELH